MTYLGLHDADGDALLVLDPGDTDGPFLVTKVDLGAVDVREDVIDDPSGDGTIDNTTATGAAAVTVELTAQGTDDRKPSLWLDDLRALCLPSERNYLHLELDEWDGPRRILVRGAAAPRDLTDIQPDTQFQWKAPLGYLEDVDESEVTLLPVGTTITGLSEPVEELVFTPPASPGGAPPFQVGGGVRPWWELDIYGSATAPVLNFGDWAVAFTSDLVIPAGHFVRVTPKTSSGPQVSYDGDPDQDLYGALDFSATTWRRLTRGGNTAVLTAALYSAGFQAVLRWRNRWP